MPWDQAVYCQFLFLTASLHHKRVYKCVQALSIAPPAFKKAAVMAAADLKQIFGFVGLVIQGFAQPVRYDFIVTAVD